MLALLPRLRRFAIGLAGSVADGDDLVQATYERALRFLHTWEPGTRLDSWMFRIARNLHLNEVRAQGVRRRHLQTVDGNEDTAVDGQREIEARIMFAATRRFIARLPEEQRAALVLVAVEGMSYAETARVLEIPIGTVTSRVARARIALKQVLGGVTPAADRSQENGHERRGP
ncbi:MAG: RNA polymerase sigma factor [Alphaproteobacteria bacterium]|nr:RNA polymerase sigma factor [Alphaproteobacteria bacterium]